MSKKPSPEVMKFMEAYGVLADEIWQVHGSAWVIKHRALERVAGERGIVFDRPAMLETNSSEGIVALVVFGSLKDRQEWSIGEAHPKNNKNAYPYAMAEKRAKDRVILKLLNIHGSLYSEEEADDFKRENPHVTRPSDIVPATEYGPNGEVIDNIPHPDTESVKKLRVADQRPIFDRLQKEIHATGSLGELQKWAETSRNELGQLKPDWQEFLRGVFAEHRDALRTQEQGDNRRNMMMAG